MSFNLELENEYNFYMNLIDRYLAMNALYFSREANKYSVRSDEFIRSEYDSIFFKENDSNLENIQMFRKVFHLSEIQFQHIILWSCNFKINENSIDSLVERLNQITEILNLLSFKIQSKSILDID